MRLYSTIARGLVELPAPPGPDRHVRLRADRLRPRPHRQRAAVRARAAGTSAGCASAATTSRSSTTSPTSTTRSTRPRRVRAPSARARRPSGTSRTSAASGSTRSTTGRRRPRRWTDIIALHRRPDRARLSPTRSRATSTSASSRFEEYGRLSGQRLDQLEDEEDDAEPAQGGSARLRALEGEQAGARTRAWDSPWGRGTARAGTSSARRWRRSCLGPASRSTAAGLDLVFPHHENELAQSRALRPRVREDLDAQRHAPLHRREDVEVGRERRATIAEVARPAGGGDDAPLLPHRPLAQPDRLLRRDAWHDASARATALREASFRKPSEPAAPEPGSDFVAVLDDDFNTPAALALMHEWRASRTSLRRALDVSALGLARRAGGRPPEVHAARRAAAGGTRREATSPEPTSCASGDREPRAGMCATTAGGYRLVRGSVTQEQVYGRRPVREALRGPARGARAVATERAVALRAVAGARARASTIKPDRRSARPPARATIRACSPGRSRTATPTRYELATVRAARCWPASTRSPTRATSAR